MGKTLTNGSFRPTCSGRSREINVRMESTTTTHPNRIRRGTTTKTKLWRCQKIGSGFYLWSLQLPNSDRCLINTVYSQNSPPRTGIYTTVLNGNYVFTSAVRYLFSTHWSKMFCARWVELLGLRLMREAD